MSANTVESLQLDEERALYHLCHATVKDCIFAGPADGESALKEARDIQLEGCRFSLRYPLWHVHGFSMDSCSMDEKTRAAIWYCENGRITNSVLGGIKALRECADMQLHNCRIDSLEFGWKCRNTVLEDSQLDGEYVFLDSRNIYLNNVQMRGKYSFQYIEDLHIRNSVLDTKDAFWHSRNVTVENCTVKGEYLAWFSENLTLINCNIIGTQPLCYCKGLKLVDCTLENTDLAFEYSDVQADIKGNILSVKNPRCGCITADSVGEVIFGDAVMECTGQVHIRNTCAE